MKVVEPCVSPACAVAFDAQTVRRRMAAVDDVAFCWYVPGVTVAADASSMSKTRSELPALCWWISTAITLSPACSTLAGRQSPKLLVAQSASPMEDPDASVE